jgi:hypothetical protein
MAHKVTGELYESITGQLFEIGRQLRQPRGYPFDPHKLKRALQSVVEGGFDVDTSVHVIDCDADPFIPPGWRVKEHRKSGRWTWNASQVILFLSEFQKNGKEIQGQDLLHGELVSKPRINANVLDFLLKNPRLIPGEWKKDEQGGSCCIFFWGTIYYDSMDNLFVRCLYLNDGEWRGSYSYLENSRGNDDLAALWQVDPS